MSLLLVPQIFGVVRPEEGGYRVGFLTRINIKNFGPELPKDMLIDKNSIKNLLLTKCKFCGFHLFF
jgi:hypothetical protein